MHKNARLTPKGRALVLARLEAGQHQANVAQARSSWSWTVGSEGGGALDAASDENALLNINTGRSHLELWWVKRCVAQ
jgi:hypothetical protein